MANDSNPVVDTCLHCQIQVHSSQLQFQYIRLDEGDVCGITVAARGVKENLKME